MKNILTTFIATIILLFTSCERDEQGHRISYYKNKTGEGYVFYKFENDSIAPINNLKVEVRSCFISTHMFIAGGHYSHSGIVYTNNEGKYSCKFGKKVDGEKVVDYEINPDYPPNVPFGFIPTIVRFNTDILDNSDKISIDTIFFHRRPY